MPSNTSSGELQPLLGGGGSSTSGGPNGVHTTDHDSSSLRGGQQQHQRQQQPPPLPSSITITPAASPTSNQTASARELLLTILTLSGPISLTTVVEFLPQILISAMVGHSNPRTALSLHGDASWTSGREGALLETYGLATLVYSTAAFSLVYGFICGLDSVASCSYGMTVDASAADAGLVAIEAAGGGSCEVSEDSETQRVDAWPANAQSAATGHSNGYGSTSTSLSIAVPSSSGNSAHVRSRSPLRILPSPGSSLPRSTRITAPTDPRHGQGGVAALRNQTALSAVNWASPPLRGVVGVPMSPATKQLFPKQRRGSGRGDQRTVSSYLAAAASNLSLHRSPSAPSTTQLPPSTMPSSGLSGPLSIISPASASTTSASRTGLSAGLSASLPQAHYASAHEVAAGALIPSPLAGLYDEDDAEDEELRRAMEASQNAGTYKGRKKTKGKEQVSWDVQEEESTTQPSSPPHALPPLHLGVPTQPASSNATAQRSRDGSDTSSTKSASNLYPSPSPSPSPSTFIGTWIARCLMLEVVVVCVLIVLLHWGTEPLLRALGEPDESIPVATAYVTAASFGLPFVAVYHALNKGLQSSGVVMPVLVISVVTKALCLIAVYVTLYHLEGNLVSLAWILVVTMAGQASAVYGYMKWTGITEAWWGSSDSGNGSSNGATSGGLFDDFFSSVLSWSGLRDYCVLAFPACVAICLEFWLFDLLGALAGVLPDPSTELAVHYLLYTCGLASYMVFSGLSVSVSVLVGQKLGCSGQSANAKKSAIVGTTACLIVSAMLMLLIALFHETLARCLTHQPRLLARFAECVPVLVAYQAVDGLNTCSTQLLRTLGVQKYGVLLHFTTYYMLGISAAYFLAFTLGYGVLGLWVGMCIGVGLNASVATVWLWIYADWEDQSQAAQTRATAMCVAGDTPSAYLSTSDSYAGGELGEHEPSDDERTTLTFMQSGNVHMDHHGN